jgi:hypothetical protein
MRKKEPSLPMLRALYLRAKYDMPETDVAAMLSVAQGTVSRWWKRGVAEGLIGQQTRHTFKDTGMSAELVDKIRQVDSWARRLELLQKIPTMNGVKVRAVRVFRSAERGSASPIDARLRRFSQQAAGVLYDTIQRATTCAVASGYTLSNAVDALAAAFGDFRFDGGTVRPPGKVRFVPVWPEDVNDPSPRVSSSALAERLDDLFNPRSSPLDESARPPRPPSLNSVPPFTPHYFETAKFRRYLEEDFPGYRELFGSRIAPRGSKPIIAEVDMLLTSIGARDRAFGRFHELLIKHAGVAADELAAIVAGDVGGVLIPAPNCTEAQRRRVRKINSIWNGLQPEHLEEIAVRSHRQESATAPGVVIVSLDSSGGGRAQVLAAAIRAGLVNELVVDEHLADGLEQQLRAGEATPAPSSRRARKAT